MVTYRCSGEQLYKLFRMEFVRAYEKPLCADGFSRLGMHEYKVCTAFSCFSSTRAETAQSHARELVEAYSWLVSNSTHNIASIVSAILTLLV